MSAATVGKKEEQLSFGDVMNKAAKSAVRGGTAGAMAMGANVAALMWIRTTVRYTRKGPCCWEPHNSFATLPLFSVIPHVQLYFFTLPLFDVTSLGVELCISSNTG